METFERIAGLIFIHVGTNTHSRRTVCISELHIKTTSHRFVRTAHRCPLIAVMNRHAEYAIQQTGVRRIQMQGRFVELRKMHVLRTYA